MSLISLASSQSVLFSSTNPAHNFSSLSHRSSRNGNWVSGRNRLHAKSADPDAGTSQVGDASSESKSGSASTSFLSVLCPLLKLFSCVHVTLQGGDPSRERNDTLEVATSSLSTLARLPWGSRSLSEGSDTQEISNSDSPTRLQLFEFEACPFCRRVREAITELDLSVEVILSTTYFSSMVKEEALRQGCWKGAQHLFAKISYSVGVYIPSMNSGITISMKVYWPGIRSSCNIILEADTKFVARTLMTGWMPTIFRAGRGMTLWEKARPDPPSKKLELFSYENNPNVGDGSSRTKLLVDITGSKEVPYLIDPNTSTQIGDYKKILSYLFQSYSASPSPV
ncbi:Thioredoxin family protein [Citrus sinensis]|nr:Thioredoxin family protein [Citrus sinensis]